MTGTTSLYWNPQQVDNFYIIWEILQHRLVVIFLDFIWSIKRKKKNGWRDLCTEQVSIKTWFGLWYLTLGIRSTDYPSAINVKPSTKVTEGWMHLLLVFDMDHVNSTSNKRLRALLYCFALLNTEYCVRN